MYLTQDDAVALMQTIIDDPRMHRVIQRAARQSTISKRHLAILERQSDATPFYQPSSEQPGGPRMGARNAFFESAADKLVQKAWRSMKSESPRAFRTLVTASCTHASSPGLERPLFDAIGLSPDVQRWNLGFMGCSAGLAALRLAHGLPPEQQTALLCTCELSSPHLQYNDDLDQITANMLFADGAAMVAVSPHPSAVEVLGCRCTHLPRASDQMNWFADDHGLRLELSSRLPVTIAENVADALEPTLAELGMSRDDIDHWLVHPGGPRILDAVESALNLPQDSLSDSRAILRNYGNMSSSTIYFIMQRFIERGDVGVCAALAFGPGLTIEMALLRITRP